jgi:hypothetical protein
MAYSVQTHACALGIGSLVIEGGGHIFAIIEDTDGR